MALVQINNNAPHFTALSSDISDNKISGLGYVGATVYLTDTKGWKIVNEDLTLSDYIIKTNAVVEGSDIQIGAVEIKDATTDTRTKVKSDGTDNAVVVMQNAQPLPNGASTSALQTTANNSLSSIDDKLSNVTVKSNAGNPSVSQTRPNDTTAYTALDVVGTSPATIIEFTNVLATAGADFVVMGASLRVDVGTKPAGMDGFRLHLYSSAPTAIADNTAFNIPSADRGKYLGYITLTSPTDFGDTLYGQTDNINFKRKLAVGSTSLFGILETIAGYTPTASTVKTVTLSVVGV